MSCVDVDECTEQGKETCSQICLNAPGTYSCGCLSGYCWSLMAASANSAVSPKEGRQHWAPPGMPGTSGYLLMCASHLWKVLWSPLCPIG